MKQILLLGLIFSLISCDKGSSASPETATPPNQGSSTPSTPPMDTFVSFATISKDVASTCIKCHSVARPGKPKLVTKEDYISEMTEVLNEVNSNEMPPTSMGFSALTTCQKAILQKWYDLGAPENSDINVNTLIGCI